MHKLSGTRAKRTSSPRPPSLPSKDHLTTPASAFHATPPTRVSRELLRTSDVASHRSHVDGRHRICHRQPRAVARPLQLTHPSKEATAPRCGARTSWRSPTLPPTASAHWASACAHRRAWCRAVPAAQGAHGQRCLCTCVHRGGPSPRRLPSRPLRYLPPFHPTPAPPARRLPPPQHETHSSRTRPQHGAGERKMH